MLEEETKVREGMNMGSKQLEHAYKEPYMNISRPIP